MDPDMVYFYVAAFIMFTISVKVMILYFAAFKLPINKRNYFTVLIIKFTVFLLCAVNTFFIDTLSSDNITGMLLVLMLIIEPLILGFLVRDVDNRPKPVKTIMIGILGNATMLLIIFLALWLFVFSLFGGI